MQAFITALETDLTATALWGAIAPVAGIIVVAILVGLGVTVLRRTVGGLSKGKAKF